MIYGSFAAMVPASHGSLAFAPAWLCHWFPALHLLFVWTTIFYPNMAKKEASMSRYPQWQAYVAQSGMLLPSPLALCLRQPRAIAGIAKCE